MEKIIPFKKEIVFNTNISEVTSISLDHTLKVDNDYVRGNFIIKGDYKITKDSDYVNDFNYEIPFEVSFDQKYNIDNSNIEITDFYYEIIDEKSLILNIEITINNIEELRCIEEESKKEIIDNEVSVKKEEVKENNDYTPYKVYIVREGDTIESIIEKYKVTRETLEQYNNLEININDKLIIPIDES